MNSHAIMRQNIHFHNLPKLVPTIEFNLSKRNIKAVVFLKHIFYGIRNIVRLGRKCLFYTLGNDVDLHIFGIRIY